MQSTPELVAACLARAGARGLLIGAAAMEAHGYGRQTYDLDCLLAISDADAFEKELLTTDYIREAAGEHFRRYVPRSIYQAPVDILLVSVETFDRIFAESGAWTVGRAEFRVPSLPHLIALKLHAMRNDPAREARDLADVLALLQANPGAVSEDELARLCRRYGPTEIAEKMRRRP